MAWTTVRDVEAEGRSERTEAWGTQAFNVHVAEELTEESKREKGITEVREAKEIVLLKKTDEWCQHLVARFNQIRTGRQQRVVTLPKKGEERSN